MYKQLKDKDAGVFNNCIQNTQNGAVIPFDPDNTDYQAYLKWVAQGNTPTPAEEQV